MVTSDTLYTIVLLSFLCCYFQHSTYALPLLFLLLLIRLSSSSLYLLTYSISFSFYSFPTCLVLPSTYSFPPSRIPPTTSPLVLFLPPPIHFLLSYFSYYFPSCPVPSSTYSLLPLLFLLLLPLLSCSFLHLRISSLSYSSHCFPLIVFLPSPTLVLLLVLPLLPLLSPSRSSSSCFIVRLSSMFDAVITARHRR